LAVTNGVGLLLRDERTGMAFDRPTEENAGGVSLNNPGLFQLMHLARVKELPGQEAEQTFARKLS
jgi:hypothetical protein